MEFWSFYDGLGLIETNCVFWQCDIMPDLILNHSAMLLLYSHATPNALLKTATTTMCIPFIAAEHFQIPSASHQFQY
jgi:hypothetical protein